MVGVGGLRLAHQRGGPRGGHGPVRDLRRDGRAARGGALRPEAFGDLGLLFAGAYGVVRTAQIVLFIVASRDDPELRQSVIGLAVSTAIGVGLLVAASFADGALQGGLWALALALDMAGPFLFGARRAGSSCPATSPSATG